MPDQLYEKLIQRLLKWFDKAGLAGWDPYDIKAHPFIIWLDSNKENNIIIKGIRVLVHNGIALSPLLSRRLLRVRPMKNTKGTGLLLASYVRLFQVTGDEAFLEKAKACADWLDNHRNKNYPGCSWGYPFDWNSRIFIPKGTPSAVVTATVGDGFYLLYIATGENKYLEVCKGICDFFLNGLNRIVDDGSHLCFSYTPIDDFQIHNSNLFVGEFLCRLGKEINRNEWVEAGLRCARFSLSEQFPEGWLPYWSMAQTARYSDGVHHHDHYHSGFEIRCLYKIWQHTGDVEVNNGWERYYQWYMKNLFNDENLPKYDSGSFYPVNIHAVAESVLCQTVLLSKYPERRAAINDTLMWSERYLEYAPGQYSYLVRKLFGVAYRQKIPMFRWGQAWMLRALCELLWVDSLNRA